MRGQKAIPTALAIASGTATERMLKYLRNEEPQPEVVDLPPPPEGIGEIAAAKWREITEMLQPLGMITEVDLGVLRLLCELWQDLEKYNADIKMHGETMITKSGVECARPVVRLRKDAMVEIRRLSESFGMTPSSRPRLKVGKGAAKMTGKLAKFLKKDA